MKPAWPICLVPPYSGQPISLATRHGKERAMARPFRFGLGAELRLAEGFDTDELGTFCGERPRTGSPREVCRLKAERGMAVTGLPVGVASEGSFGPHPLVPFLPVGEEWMTYVDRDRNLLIEERLLARRTNFAHRVLHPGEDPGSWLAAIGFPSHGVIVRAHLPPSPEAPVVRGIQDRRFLGQAIQRAALQSGDGRVLLETDMRAHRNPTRMAAIRALSFRLVRRIVSRCPACGTPGWGRIRSEAGLPCGWCGAPTDLTRQEIHGCVACAHEEARDRRDRLLQADPGHCPRCNP